MQASSSMDRGDRNPAITAAARNAAAVQKIFSDHYTKAKVTAGAVRCEGLHLGGRGAREGHQEGYGINKGGKSSSFSPSPSASGSPFPSRDGKLVGGGERVVEGGGRNFLIPKAGIEAYTGGNILAGDVQPEWQRPTRRDTGCGIWSSSSSGGGGSESDDGISPGRGTDPDADMMMMMGSVGGRRMLQTSISQQEKELRMLSEKIYGVGAPTRLREKKIAHVLGGGGSKVKGRSSPLGVGQRVDQGAGPGASSSPSSPLHRHLSDAPTSTTNSSGGGGKRKTSVPPPPPPLPSSSSYFSVGTGAAASPPPPPDSSIGDNYSHDAPPPPPPAHHQQDEQPWYYTAPTPSSTPPVSPHPASHPPYSAYPARMENAPPLRGTNTARSTSQGIGEESRSALPPRRETTPQEFLTYPPPSAQEYSLQQQRHWPTRNHNHNDNNVHMHNHNIHHYFPSSCASSSSSPISPAPLPDSSPSEVPLENWDRASGKNGPAAVGKVGVGGNGLSNISPDLSPEERVDSRHKDPHRSYTALKRAKAKHAFSLPSTKPMGGGGRGEGGAQIWSEEEELERLYVYATQKKKDNNGGGGRGRRQYPCSQNGLEEGNGGFVIPKGKIRQLSKQRQAQMEREKHILEYEQTLPLRRAADPFVQQAYQPGQLHDARPLVVPTERTLQILSEKIHGEHPIIGNVYRQQLLRGEPLVRRVMRGDFYNSPQADSYAVVPNTGPLSGGNGIAQQGGGGGALGRSSSSPTSPPPQGGTSFSPSVAFPNSQRKSTAKQKILEEEEKLRGGGEEKSSVPYHYRTPLGSGRSRVAATAAAGGGSGGDDEGRRASSVPRAGGGRAFSGQHRPRQKMSYIQRNKERIHLWSDFNTRQRFHQEQLLAKSVLPPRRKPTRRQSEAPPPTLI